MTNIDMIPWRVENSLKSMMHNSETLAKEIFWEQPNFSKLSPNIKNLLNQFWAKVEELTHEIADPVKRALIDQKLLKLSLDVKAAEWHNKERIYRIMAWIHNPQNYT